MKFKKLCIREKYKTYFSEDLNEAVWHILFGTISDLDCLLRHRGDSLVLNDFRCTVMGLLNTHFLRNVGPLKIFLFGSVEKRKIQF